MAGLYPDVPGHRMAYDRDGTFVAFGFLSGTVTPFTTADKRGANDADPSTMAFVAGFQYVITVFPQQRDIRGLFQSVDNANKRPTAWQWSNDTTNGSDGTWTAFTGPTGTAVPDQPPGAKDLYRTMIYPVTVNNVKAIRSFTTNNQNYGLVAHHIYGHETTPQNLQLWHPTLDQRADPAYLDWAEQSQASSDPIPQRSFRIKNHHTTETRTSIMLSVEALAYSTPHANAGLHDLSADGVTWSATLPIANIAPGAISPVYYVRRRFGGTLGVWDARIVSTSD
jgi:hypothetical protein